MMKKILVLLLALCLLLGCMAGCGNTTPDSTEPTGSAPVGGNETSADEAPEIDLIDYAVEVKLDFDSETAKEEVTVKSFIDGDTTHFYVSENISATGVLKARYLAVNTPESTGKIEPWGKKASNFTKEKLSSADSIVLESDDANWNLDSTGGRHLVWVWYRPAGTDTYRNLNIDLLQNGLSLGSSATSNRYGQLCLDAIQQSKAAKLHIHSNQDDPDFYYGDAIPTTLKELRTNAEQYEGVRVAFDGVVTHSHNNTVYVEEYDDETGMYFGVPVYYGYGFSGTGLKILSVGNRVRIIGKVGNHFGTWQISDVNYVDMRPNDPNNVQLLEEGVAPSFVVTDPVLFNTGKVSVDVMPTLDEDFVVTETFDYAALAEGASIAMVDLRVTSVYTTNSDTDSNGAMTLTCRNGDQTISVRTEPLHDANGDLIVAAAYQSKTIDVKGVVECYNGAYQIKVFSADDIIVKD